MPPSYSTPQLKLPDPKRKTFVSGLIVSTVFCLLFAGAFLLAQHLIGKPSPEHGKGQVARGAAPDKNEEHQTSETAQGGDGVETPTKNFLAEDGSFEFDYPASWSVEDSSNRGDATVTLLPLGANPASPLGLTVHFYQFPSEERVANLISSVAEAVAQHPHVYFLEQYVDSLGRPTTILSAELENFILVEHHIIGAENPPQFTVRVRYVVPPTPEGKKWKDEMSDVIASIRTHIDPRDAGALEMARASAEKTARLKSLAGSFRFEAEIRSDGGSYANTCSASSQILKDLRNEVGAGGYKCSDIATAWVLWTKHPDDTFFCVDSTGEATSTDGFGSGTQCLD